MRGALTLVGWLVVLLASAAAAGCVETVRCPEGEIFDERGECIAIPDAGTDAGSPDAGS